MCSCVSGEVLKQCRATNPADIYVPSMAVLYRLKGKSHFILIFMPVLHCCLYAYVYIILTSNEYYTVLPALAINAASNKLGLAASASHNAFFI